MLDIAVIIVSWNVRDYLQGCLRAVQAELALSDLRGAVWVVDNGSTDGTPQMIQEQFPDVHLIANKDNPGFGAANNQGMRAASALEPETYFILNPDTVVQPGALRELYDGLMDRPSAAMVGARLVYGDGRFQHSAFYFPGVRQLLFDLFPMPARLYESKWNGRYGRHQFRMHADPLPVDHPLGAAMLVRTGVAAQTGGFDERFHMYCEEIDWCWRIQQAGWQVYAVPKAEIIHFGGESTRQIPAQSLVNLWRSRAQLYFWHQPRWRFTLARWLVRLGMRRKLAGSSDTAMQQAYAEIIALWNTAESWIGALPERAAGIGAPT